MPDLPRDTLTAAACMERARLAWDAAEIHYRRWLRSQGKDRESYNWWQHYEGIYAHECRLAEACHAVQHAAHVATSQPAPRRHA